MIVVINKNRVRINKYSWSKNKIIVVINKNRVRKNKRKEGEKKRPLLLPLFKGKG